MIEIDFETRSQLPISAGAYNYARHHSTEILLIAFAIDGGKVELIDLTKESNEDWPLMMLLRDSLYDDEEILEAWNAQFEYYILKYVGHKHGLPAIPLHRFKDLMAVSTRFGYPLGLDKSGKALGLPPSEQKKGEGKALIKLFSIPNSEGTFNRSQDHSEKWNKFREYAIQDVKTMRRIKEMLPGENLQKQEQLIWEIDTEINERGVKVDFQYAKNAIDMVEEEKETLEKEIQELTNGAVTTGSQVVRIMDFIEQFMKRPTDLTKESVQTLLDQKDLHPKVRQILELRVLLGKSSISKYKQMEQTLSYEDERIRGLFQYNGAYRTSRWGGRGVQPHSLPRGKYKVKDEDLNWVKSKDFDSIRDNYGKLSEFLSSTIRQTFIADEHKTFYISDYSGIENRVVAWLVEDKRLLQYFVEGVDQYRLMAGKIFNKNPEHVTGDERFLGKQVILGCGYSMGASKFMSRMDQMGVELNAAQSEEYITVYRKDNPKIVSAWYEISDCLIEAIQKGKSSWNKIKLIYKKSHLFIILPNGKQLCFPQVKLRRNDWGNLELTYMQEVYGKWVRTSTYGGKILENLAQAISREILAEAIVKLEVEGFKVVMHVHDEIVCEEYKDANRLETMEEIMITSSPWAENLPLQVESFISERYRK